MTAALTKRRYADHLAQQGLATSTIRVYLTYYCRWVDWCQPDDDPLELYGPEIMRWSGQLPMSASSRHLARSMIRQLAGMVGHPGTPWEAVRTPREPRRISRALTHEEARQLARCAADVGGAAGLAVLIGLFTAARRAELAGMRWDKLDMAQGTWTFWRPKNKGYHTVPVSPALLKYLLQRIPPDTDEERWVFPGRYGGHVTPTVLGDWVKKVAILAGLPQVSTHVLRHTALTEANDRTRDLRAVQELAGHVKPTTTVIYTRVHQQRLRDAVDSLDWLD